MSARRHARAPGEGRGVWVAAATLLLGLGLGVSACSPYSDSPCGGSGRRGGTFRIGDGYGGDGTGGGGSYPGQYPGWVDPNDPYTSWDTYPGALATRDLGQGASSARPDENGCYTCDLECRVADGGPLPNGAVIHGFSSDGHADACLNARAGASDLAGGYVEGCRDLASSVSAKPTVDGGGPQLHPFRALAPDAGVPVRR